MAKFHVEQRDGAYYLHATIDGQLIAHAACIGRDLWPSVVEDVCASVASYRQAQREMRVSVQVKRGGEPRNG